MTERAIEQRLFHRVPFQTNGVLRHGAQTWDIDILDLSLKGVLLRAPTNWSGEIGDLYQLHFSLSEEVQIDMEVKLVHIRRDQLGCHCQHIDLESIIALRRLVELNLGDSVLLERDIAALGHDA